MTDMMEIYSGERARVEKELEGIRDITAAADCLCAALERMRMACRARSSSAQQRASADRLFDVSCQAVRCMLSISGAEVKVVQEEQMTSTPMERVAALLPMAAMAVGAALTVWTILEKLTGPALLAVALTAIAWLETQVVYRRRVGVAARPKINVYELMRLFDRLVESLEDALEMSAQEKGAQISDAGATLDNAFLEPVQMLLEAANTQDGDYALKALPALLAALQAQGIETVAYCQEKQSCFDMYPGIEAGVTIRPALMRDGKGIARGQATEEMQ